MIFSNIHKITMYRIMLYYLLSLLVCSVVLGRTGHLPFEPYDIILSSIGFIAVCYLSNMLIARAVQAKPNFESSIITGLILALIVGPLSISSLSNVLVLICLSLIAMASKYLVAYRARHVLNPAAAAVVAGAFLFSNGGASWWVGHPALIWFVIAGGVIVFAKIRRWHVVIPFLAVYLGLSIVSGLYAGGFDVAVFLRGALLSSPILFFCFVMLIEPVTAPQGKRLRIWYGFVVGVLLFLIQNQLPYVGYGIELSLIIGNALFRGIAPDQRTVLRLKRKEEIANNTIAFWFEPERPLHFIPGQFLEWTLPHSPMDSRGTRRYFTIASSSTESDILLVTKFAPRSSSFKKALSELKSGEEVSVANLEGEFVLPPTTGQPIVFIAGGVGVTPFRSMIKYLLDTESRGYDITLLYSNRSQEDIGFRDLFQEATDKLGLKTVYTLTEEESVSSSWRGETGTIDAVMIKRTIPRWHESIFYVSGPEPMVQAFEKMLIEMGIRGGNIKHDYFPGYSAE